MAISPEMAGVLELIRNRVGARAEELEWSNYRLMVRSGVHKTTVYRYRNGMKGTISVESLLRLAYAMGMEPQEYMPSVDTIRRLMAKSE